MNFFAISTEIAIVILMAVVVIGDLLMPKEASRAKLGYLTICGLLAVLLYSLSQYHICESPAFYAGLYTVDNYALFFKQLFIVGIIFTVLFSVEYVDTMLTYRGEYYALLLSALLGMCVLASANDFMTVFVGLELMTVSFYILVSMKMTDTLSSEAGTKYLIVGAVSTAVMLYGISLIYGSTGTLIFAEIWGNTHLLRAAGMAGAVMVMIGFFFKLSVIPFHMWAPDVYQGAPTPVTALLAMGSKAAGIAVFMRILFAAFPILGGLFVPMLAVLSAVCMIGGNVMAIKQDDVKRMLAYSSIAQAGYMMVGIVAAGPAGMKAVMFYAMLYVFANVGAFAVLSTVESQRGGTGHSDITGLAQTAPLLAAVMTVSLLSMAGIPPTAGFAGKIYLFSAVVDQGHLWLAFVGFVMSMISVYYYFMVTKAMYRDISEVEEKAGCLEPVKVSLMVRAAALIAVITTIGIGLWPEGLAQLTNLAAYTFLR